MFSIIPKITPSLKQQKCNETFSEARDKKYDLKILGFPISVAFWKIYQKCREQLEKPNSFLIKFRYKYWA